MENKNDEVKNESEEIKDDVVENLENESGEAKEDVKTDEDLKQEYLDGWRRCQADFENYRRMQSEERKSLVKFASQEVLMQIIPVVDNFSSSVEHIPEDKKNDPWVTGIMYIQKQLETVLKDNGVKEIEVKVGDEFDANVCESIESQSLSSEEAGSDSDNKIKKVVLKGYRIGDRVIRPARVIVG